MIARPKTVLVPEKEIEHITNWIRNYFADNGSAETCAVIGISGGKDSTIAAALCARAIGPERVIGVLMPDGEQEDIDVARRVCEYLGIKSCEINIYDTMTSFFMGIPNEIITGPSLSNKARINSPARIRMAYLYAVAAQVGGRVVCTCNRSEEYVGWSTKYGDAAGDFAPLLDYTVREVKTIGQYLGLPDEFVNKVPIDGLCGKTDEESFGFTYEQLDAYILDNVIPDVNTLGHIKWLYRNSKHKRDALWIPHCKVLTQHPIGEEWKPHTYITF